MAYDWLTANLYALYDYNLVRRIYVCDTSSTRLICTTITMNVKGLSSLRGITLDLPRGYVYIKGKVFGVKVGQFNVHLRAFFKQRNVHHGV